MIERLNGRPSLLLSAAALLLVVLVGWFGFVSPQRQKAEEIGAEIALTEAQIDSTEALTQGSLVRQSARELATLRTAIPDEVQMSAILRQLSSASAAAKVRITGITPQPRVATGAADAIPITVAVEGRYFGIREFLRLLRTRADVSEEAVRATGRLFEIDSIQFTGGTTTGGVIQATLTAKAFAFSGVAATGGADVTLPPLDDSGAPEASGP